MGLDVRITAAIRERRTGRIVSVFDRKTYESDIKFYPELNLEEEGCFRRIEICHWRSMHNLFVSLQEIMMNYGLKAGTDKYEFRIAEEAFPEVYEYLLKQASLENEEENDDNGWGTPAYQRANLENALNLLNVMMLPQFFVTENHFLLPEDYQLYQKSPEEYDWEYFLEY